MTDDSILNEIDGSRKIIKIDLKKNWYTLFAYSMRHDDGLRHEITKGKGDRGRSRTTLIKQLIKDGD